MSNFINITVKTNLSTDFYIEVPDNATESQIKALAEKEVVLPHTYPQVLDNFLKTRMGIQVQGMDSMLRAWNVDNIEYIIDGGNHTTPEGE